MIGRMIRAFGADDVATLTPAKFRKLRFLMIANRNMRLALDMFTLFMTSGATDVDKMLRIYHESGSYFVAFHEFVKSIMLAERRYYKDESSQIINIFESGPGLC